MSRFVDFLFLDSEEIRQLSLLDYLIPEGDSRTRRILEESGTPWYGRDDRVLVKSNQSKECDAIFFSRPSMNIVLCMNERMTNGPVSSDIVRIFIWKKKRHFRSW